MNYSKNLRKAAMAKRVIILLCIAFFLGVVGGVSGYALKAHITVKDREKTQIHINGQADAETLVYGAYDDRCFTEEVSLDWGVCELDSSLLIAGCRKKNRNLFSTCVQHITLISPLSWH